MEASALLVLPTVNFVRLKGNAELAKIPMSSTPKKDVILVVLTVKNAP